MPEDRTEPEDRAPEDLATEDLAAEESVPTVRVDFALAIGPRRLNASLDVPAVDVTLTQLLPVLQTLTDGVVEGAVEVAKGEGRTVSCRAGCGACCRQLVAISVFEAEALAEWIRTLPPEEQAELRARFDAALLALRDAGMLARIDAQNWGSLSDSERREEVSKLALDYIQLRVPCPFLRDESCSIHPMRPLICREYLVTSPPEFCVYPTRDRVSGVEIPVKISSVLHRLAHEADPSSRGWIPLVYLFGWMELGARPGDTVHAIGPELLHRVVNKLAKA
jgi:Fe-S-cluster containining protein